MSDLSRALVDAAAEAVHARLCGCGQSAADADEHIETGRVAVAAVDLPASRVGGRGEGGTAMTVPNTTVVGNDTNWTPPPYTRHVIEGGEQRLVEDLRLVRDP